jgi:hypothetical protein
MAGALVAGIAVGSSAPVSAEPSVRALGAILTGEEEVPGPGDEDGIGAAGILVTARGRLCYFVAVKHIEPAIAAHIHAGADGVAGDIVVALDTPNRRGFSANCSTISTDLAAQLIATPEAFYVNVHTADFPMGAVRGQLG